MPRRPCRAAVTEIARQLAEARAEEFQVHKLHDRYRFTLGLGNYELG